MGLELKKEYEDLPAAELIRIVRDNVEKNIKELKGVSYLCVFKAIYDMINTTVPYESAKMLTGFGGGFGLSGKNVCGALSGGMAALGLVYGSLGPIERSWSEILKKGTLKERQEKYQELFRKKAIYNQFVNRVQERFGSCICKKLIEHWSDDPFEPERTRNCFRIMKGAAEIAMELMLEAEKKGLDGFDFGDIMWVYDQ